MEGHEGLSTGLNGTKLRRIWDSSRKDGPIVAGTKRLKNHLENAVPYGTELSLDELGLIIPFPPGRFFRGGLFLARRARLRSHRPGTFRNRI